MAFTLVFLYLLSVAKRNDLIFFSSRMSDLPIIQKTYDLIKWYVPILNRLRRDHKFLLANRIITELYDLLDGLILARYARQNIKPSRIAW